MFFPQFHRVFAKIFIDENTGTFQKFRSFSYFLSLFKFGDATKCCARRFWFFFLDSRCQWSISICSFILCLFLTNSCNLITQSSQVSFCVSVKLSIHKLFRLDLPSSSINFEESSFGSKRSSSIPLMPVSKFLMFCLILFIFLSHWSRVNFL